MAKKKKKSAKKKADKEKKEKKKSSPKSSKEKKSKKGKKKKSKKSKSKSKKVSISLNKISWDDVKEKAQKAWENFKSNKILMNVLIWIVVFFVSLVVVDFGVQYLNYHASAAVVNGERIYNGEFNDKLRQSYGETVISQMIDEKIIRQEARNQDVEISDEEVEKEIEQLEKDYGGADELDNQLEMNGTSRARLEDQIETVLIVQKILGDDIEITEQEKKDFYEEYKDVLFTENEDPTYEESEEKIEEILTEQKVSQELQPWLAELKDEANIQNNVEQPKKYKLLRITKDFVNELLENTLPDEEESEE